MNKFRERGITTAMQQEEEKRPRLQWRRWGIKTAVEEMGNQDCSGGDGESRLQWRRWGIKTAVEEMGNQDCSGGDGESRLNEERAIA